MMRKKIIFHIDIDSFFCSVEKIFDKSLIDKPFVVCGRNKRSVVGSTSYEARDMGVKAGMPVYKVELISKSIQIVNYNSDKYNKMSNMFFKIIKNKFSSLIEIASIDECYIDVTKYIDKLNISPVEYAKRIQNYMLAKINLPCSIGISDHKYLAKIATSIKKPFGIYEMYSNEIQQKLWPLNVNNILGVGKGSEVILNSLNIFKIQDIIDNINNKDIQKIIGKNWEYFKGVAQGILNDQNIQNVERKSIGHSVTFLNDLTTIREIREELKIICKELVNRMYQEGWLAKNISIGLKDENRNFKTRNKKLEKYTDDVTEIYNISFKLIMELIDDKYFDIRLISISASELRKDYNEEIKQISIFNKKEYKPDKNDKAKRIMNEVNKKMNKKILFLKKTNR